MAITITGTPSLTVSGLALSRGPGGNGPYYGTTSGGGATSSDSVVYKGPSGNYYVFPGNTGAALPGPAGDFPSSGGWGGGLYPSLLGTSYAPSAFDGGAAWDTARNLNSQEIARSNTPFTNGVYFVARRLSGYPATQVAGVWHPGSPFFSDSLQYYQGFEPFPTIAANAANGGNPYPSSATVALGDVSVDLKPYVRATLAGHSGAAVVGARIEIGCRFSDGTSFSVHSGLTGSTGATAFAASDWGMGRGGVMPAFKATTGADHWGMYYYVVSFPNGQTYDTRLDPLQTGYGGLTATIPGRSSIGPATYLRTSGSWTYPSASNARDSIIELTFQLSFPAYTGAVPTSGLTGAANFGQSNGSYHRAAGSRADGVVYYWRSGPYGPQGISVTGSSPWDVTKVKVSAPASPAVDSEPSLVVLPSGDVGALFTRTGGSTPGAYLAVSGDDGATWRAETLIIPGGTHPAMAVHEGQVVFAAYVGGNIKACYQGPGDAAPGAVVTLKDQTGAAIAVADDSFGLCFPYAGVSPLLLHVRAGTDTDTSEWICYHESELAFVRVT